MLMNPFISAEKSSCASETGEGLGGGKKEGDDVRTRPANPVKPTFFRLGAGLSTRRPTAGPRALIQSPGCRFHAAFDRNRLSTRLLRIRRVSGCAPARTWEQTPAPKLD